MLEDCSRFRATGVTVGRQMGRLKSFNSFKPASPAEEQRDSLLAAGRLAARSDAFARAKVEEEIASLRSQ